MAAAPASELGESDETPSLEELARLSREDREREEKRLAAEKAAREADELRLKALEAKVGPFFDEAYAALRDGDENAAEAAYRKATAAAPEAFAAHLNLGVLAERRGRTDEARAAYEKALSIRPDYAEASENLVRLLVRQGRGDEAESGLRQRIRRFPRSIALRNQYVRVLLALGRAAEAETEAKRVLKVDERNTDAMLHLASLWYGQKKYELARTVLDNARQVDPNDPAVWNLLAFCQLALEQRPLALESLRKASALREDFPEAHNNHGALLAEMNDCDGAIRELELAARHAPDSADVRVNLGNAYRCARRFGDARTQYERALALDPKLADPWFDLAILQLDGEVPSADGKVPEKLERLKASLAAFDRYRQAGGDDARLSRYADEAKKGVEREEARLVRVAESKRRSDEKAKKEAERLRLAEERAKEEAAKRRAAFEAKKVAHRGEIEDDGFFAPARKE
jgi:Tfp pilus assembly protein PilF